MPTDPELLNERLRENREQAFHALVARHAGLVYATAKRSCRDDSLAAEASQLTFFTLAQKAKFLTSCASLGGLGGRHIHLVFVKCAKILTAPPPRSSSFSKPLHGPVV